MTGVPSRHQEVLVSQPAHPAFVITYAPSGAGKTVDCGYSFPVAVFAAAPGALESIRSTCGYDPEGQRREVRTMADARNLIKVARESGIKTIVFDDFSHIAEQTFASIEASWRGKPDLRGMYGALATETLTFRDTCRYAGINVILNAWEKQPAIRAGVAHRGGPQLPGNLPEAIPALCDLVLRGSLDPMRKPWPGVYLSAPNASWIQKNRFEAIPATAPMNLGEILRHTGYVIDRHPGLAWQEDAVEKIAKLFLSVQPHEQAEAGRQAYAALEAKTPNKKVITWTLRDAVDRAALRRMTADSFTATTFGW